MALIDDEDTARVGKYKWSAVKSRQTYYATRHTEHGDYISLHQFIMNPPPGFIVDHIDGNGLNNQKANLRVCRKAENAMNRTKTIIHSSRFKGVSFNKAQGKWQASIRVNRLKIHLGYFDSEEIAAQAYDYAARRHFGEYAACGVTA